MRIQAIAVLAGSLAAASLLHADEWTKRTVVTWSEPVMVAGVPVVTLPAGTYVIRLMNHDHNRNIVQIFNEREDHLFTTVLAIANYRLEPKEKTEFRFWETPSGNPIALRAWFYPGDRWGQEFVYPKGLAAQIARVEPIPVTPAETVAELPTAPITEMKAGEEAPLEEAFVAPEPAPAPEPVAVAEAPAAEPAPAPLPLTASPFAMIGLLGASVTAAGAALRKFAARRS